MVCPHCGHENEEGNKFCTGCGELLSKRRRIRTTETTTKNISSQSRRIILPVRIVVFIVAIIFIVLVTNFIFVQIIKPRSSMINRNISHQQFVPHQINQNVQSRTNFSITGRYVGKIGPKDFILSLERINGNKVEGYDIAGINKRPVSGTIVGEREVSNNGNPYTAVSLKLQEPGTDRWDGEFNIILCILPNSSSPYKGEGYWKAYNGKLERQITIKRY